MLYHAPLRSARLFGASVLALWPALAAAQDGEVHDLGVILADTGGAQTDTPAASHIDRDTLTTEHAGSGLASVLQSVPGVSVQTGIGGDAELSVNIRGMQDHGRVVVTVDGVRQNFAKSGHGANGTFAVDPDMLRSVEVQRGPGGKAGAIGGSVEMRTIEAADILPEDGDAMGAEYKFSLGTHAAGPGTFGAVAARLGPNSDLLLALNHGQRSDYTAPDGTRVFAAQNTRTGLLKLGTTTKGGARFTFSAEALNQRYITSRETSTPRDVSLQKRTFALVFDVPSLAGGWEVTGSLYRTGMRVHQAALTPGLTPTGAARSYRTRTTGILAEAFKAATIGGRTHDIALVLDGFRDSVETRDIATSLTPSGQRDFWSLAVSDRIEFGRMTATFGVSFDHYRLSGGGIRSADQAISPRIALTFPLTPSLDLHASAARTFRAPTLNETLVNGLHPPPADFEVRPNPNLRPEQATNLEIGLTYDKSGIFSPGDNLALAASIFQNTVRDYIGFEEVGTVFNKYFQYQNIDRARVRGLEIEASYDTDRVFARLSGHLMRGVDLGTGLELDDVAPSRVSLTGGVYSADGRSRIGARYTASAAKKSAGGVVRNAAWETLDLFFSREINDQAQLTVSLNNVLDENYTAHLQTQPQPGFNAQASLVIRF